MNFDTVEKELIKEILEIKPFYDKELERWHGEEPGPHIVFGDVINPYLIDLLEINKNDK